MNTEIKKRLYKEKPEATFSHIKMGIAYYQCTLRNFDNTIPVDENIIFQIPVSDMGDAQFESRMQAQLLIRWLS